jgi:hypothetical protein
MELLTTSGISHQIENLIKTAKEQVWLVSPYLKIHKQLLDRLVRADANGIKCTIVYGKNELHTSEWDKLNQLINTSIYFCPNLHAKIFINESYGLIGSMNLYDYSQINNIELGALFHKKRDFEFYHNTLDEIDSIINLSEIKKVTLTAETLDTISADERMQKAKKFYAQFESDLELVEMKVIENIVSDRKSFEFSGRLKYNGHIYLSNQWGFISIWSEKEGLITDDIRERAKDIALSIDRGNRFYNHRHANRFCVYDPKHSGDESYLDDGDAELIRRFIDLFKTK